MQSQDQSRSEVIVASLQAAPELEQIQDRLAKRRNNFVWPVRRRGCGPWQRVYLVVEQQSTMDRSMALPMVEYLRYLGLRPSGGQHSPA